jgi:hypothetical protein
VVRFLCAVRWSITSLNKQNGLTVNGVRVSGPVLAGAAPTGAGQDVAYFGRA